MRNAKTAAMNLYQKEALKPIDKKYSPLSRRVQQSPQFKVVIKNPQLHRATNKVRKLQEKEISKNKLRESALYASLPMAQKKLSLSNANYHRYSSTTLRKESLPSRNHVVRTPREQKEFQFRKQKAASERLRTQQQQLIRQQIQYKRNEMSREKEIKLKRQSSQRSFVLESHKETIDMMKRTRQIRSRSQIKLVKDKYKETQKEHQFLVTASKKAELQKRYEHQYHKAFIKNTKLPKFNYPDLADTLAIASKTLTNNKKQYQIKSTHTNTKRQSKPKLQPLKPLENVQSAKEELNQPKFQSNTFLTAQDSTDNHLQQGPADLVPLQSTPHPQQQVPQSNAKQSEPQHRQAIQLQPPLCESPNQQQQLPKQLPGQQQPLHQQPHTQKEEGVGALEGGAVVGVIQEQSPKVLQ